MDIAFGRTAHIGGRHHQRIKGKGAARCGRCSLCHRLDGLRRVSACELSRGNIKLGVLRKEIGQLDIGACGKLKFLGREAFRIADNLERNPREGVVETEVALVKLARSAIELQPLVLFCSFRVFRDIIAIAEVLIQ